MFDRIRAAWRALWTSTTAPVAVAAPPARDLRISNAVLWEAERHGSRAFMPEETFLRARPLPNTLPDGFALDSLPQVDTLTSYALQQLHHEGLGFLGYPYLAELSQRGEYRKIASIWAEHCTRKWIKLSGDDEKVKKLEAALEDLAVRETFRTAIERECFFGRMQIFMDFGDWDNPAEMVTPLVVDDRKIGPARPLKRLSLVEPMWCYPGIYSAQNPLAPDFYRPSNWFVSGRTVHSSRLLTLVGHEMPNMLKPAYAFGGVSLTQLCKPYVDNWLRTRQSVSDLISAFSVMVLKTNMEGVLRGGPGDNVFARIDLFNKTRDNRGTFAIDKNEEEFANVSAPIAGLHELQAQAQEQMSSISSIPLVILLGITPSGLNASSEGEIRVFYDAIMAYNERVCAPSIRTLLDVVQLSVFGKIDPDITFEFESLWEMSDKDKADVRKSDAEADTAYINSGVVDAGEVRDRLRNDETSLYHGVDLSGPAPDPEDVPADPEDEQGLPFSEDEWREQDHPRDKDGKFGSGGSVHELDGTEVAPETVSLKELRDAAKTYFDKHLRGLKVESAALGKEVGFNSSGFRETKSWSAHPDKLRLFPAVPDVIERGRLVSSVQNRKPANETHGVENTKAFHTIEAPVSLRGEKLRMQVVVKETTNGHFHYDHWAIEHKKDPGASDSTFRIPNAMSKSKATGAAAVRIGDFGDSINIGIFRED